LAKQPVVLGIFVGWCWYSNLFGRTFGDQKRVYTISIPAFAMLNLPTTEDRLGKSPQRLVRYFVLAMALVYLGLGVWLWVTAKTPGGGLLQLPPTGRRVLGSVFILYGLLRFVRGYQAHFRKKHLTDDDE
jgi:hypothetical protein